MIGFNQLQNGISRYIEAEITPQISGWQRIVVATGAGLLLSKLPDKLRSLPLGLVDADKVDVDAIYTEARKHLSSPVSVDIPGIGSISFGASDLDKLYSYLR